MRRPDSADWIVKAWIVSREFLVNEAEKVKAKVGKASAKKAN
jgi:hypothetical protein